MKEGPRKRTLSVRIETRPGICTLSGIARISPSASWPQYLNKLSARMFQVLELLHVSGEVVQVWFSVEESESSEGHRSSAVAFSQNDVSPPGQSPNAGLIAVADDGPTVTPRQVKMMMTGRTRNLLENLVMQVARKSSDQI